MVRIYILLYICCSFSKLWVVHDRECAVCAGVRDIRLDGVHSFDTESKRCAATLWAKFTSKRSVYTQHILLDSVGFTYSSRKPFFCIMLVESHLRSSLHLRRTWKTERKRCQELYRLSRHLFFGVDITARIDKTLWLRNTPLSWTFFGGEG